MKLNNNKYIIPLIALFSFIILNFCIIYKTYKKIDSNNSIFRLHIVANSNDISDQITKLKINENIQKYISTLNLNNKSNDEISNILKENSASILNITNNILKNENKNYRATLEIGKIKYDEKDSTLIHMDEGVYNSAKIILGCGNGKNIWSFICPSEENLSKLINYETIMPGISKIYSNVENISYSSKILETIKNIK